MNWKIIVLIIVLVFFIIGMICGNYNCSGHFCNTITSLVNFITDVVKTEVKGITTAVNGISHLFE